MTVCEGATDDNTIHLCFADEKKAAEWRGNYCYTMNYGNCIICQMLEQKYE